MIYPEVSLAFTNQMKTLLDLPNIPNAPATTTFTWNPENAIWTHTVGSSPDMVRSSGPSQAEQVLCQGPTPQIGANAAPSPVRNWTTIQ